MRTLRGYTIMALAVAALLLGGCATLTTSQKVDAWKAACHGYALKQQWIIGKMTSMSDATLQKYLIVTHQITPLCETLPTNTVQATQQITKATTTLAILGAAQGVKK